MREISNMQVKGPIDWFEILRIDDGAVLVRLKTFEGEEYEAQLAPGDCIRSAIPEDTAEDSYPLLENYLAARPLPPGLFGETCEETDTALQSQFAQFAQSAARKNPLLEELEKLEPRLRGLKCPECGFPEQPAITMEGVVTLCRQCGAGRRVDADILQRLSDKLGLRCFACDTGALKSVAAEYANILKCLNPACGNANSWRGVSDRFSARPLNPSGSCTE